MTNIENWRDTVGRPVPRDVCSLTAFQRSPHYRVRKAARAGRILVITQRGKPVAVLDDPRRYARMTGLAREAGEIETLEKLFGELKAWKDRPLDEFIGRFWEKRAAVARKRAGRVARTARKRAPRRPRKRR